MRKSKNYINLDGNFESSFLSCEKDTELIINKLFIESKPYSDELKRLLLINNKDCLDDRTNQAYKDKIIRTSIKDLVDKKYIRLSPKIEMEEHEEVKSYLLISFDNFSPTSNLHYKDCTIMIDVICHTDYWDIGNYRQRPLKIAGFVDGILNQARLTGIGTLEFIGANELILSDELAGYCLVYRAVHGDEDDEEIRYDEETGLLERLELDEE